MKAMFDKMNIHKITFETGDSDVYVNTTIQQGNLSYDTELVISFSDLNVLINNMQKQIDHQTDISSLFETDKMYNGNLMYNLDFEKKLNRSVQLESMEFTQSIRQIRA